MFKSSFPCEDLTNVLPMPEPADMSILVGTIHLQQDINTQTHTELQRMQVVMFSVIMYAIILIFGCFFFFFFL